MHQPAAPFRKITANEILLMNVLYHIGINYLVPTDVKNSESVKVFKIILEKFKVASISGNVYLNGQFWELPNKFKVQGI